MRPLKLVSVAFVTETVLRFRSYTAAKTESLAVLYLGATCYVLMNLKFAQFSFVDFCIGLQ